MSADDLHRRRLDAVFGLFLASGVTVGAYCVWAVADWIHSQGEGPSASSTCETHMPDGWRWTSDGALVCVG
jgi:hypothetical protein